MKRTFRRTGRADAPADVAREIEMHIELRTREFEAAGMSHDDARRAALDAFGDRDAIAGEVTDIRRSTVTTHQAKYGRWSAR